jgi:hypothetical protein
MSHFFATADDLLPVFESVESRRTVLYTLSGHVTEKNVMSFSSGAQLPTLRMPMTEANASSCPAYLVSEVGAEIALREISSNVWAIDQLANSDTTMLQHGGMYGNSVLLHGRVASASKTKTSTSLQRAFDSAIKKHFVRIQSFYVGPQAEKLLDNGIRLTMGALSPREYDLKR